MATQLIRLQLIDGDPDGLRIAGMAGRTTILIACPWTDVKALLQRDEAKRPGVYVLVGKPLSDAGTAPSQVIYIGECESLADRFNGKHHVEDKAEWTEIFLGTTTESAFNKAHARQAEHLLVQRAKISKRADVINGGTSAGKLDDGDSAFAQEFVANVAILAQTLGLPAFRSPVSNPIVSAAVPDGASAAKPAPVFEFKYTNHPVPAQMVPDGKEFIIKEGSLARKVDMPGLGDGYRALREKARKSGILIPSDKEGYERFTTDFPTSSTSAAGALIYGSACAGPTAWFHVETKQSYRDWQAEQAGQK